MRLSGGIGDVVFNSPLRCTQLQRTRRLICGFTKASAGTTLKRWKSFGMLLLLFKLSVLVSRELETPLYFHWERWPQNHGSSHSVRQKYAFFANITTSSNLKSTRSAKNIDNMIEGSMADPASLETSNWNKAQLRPTRGTSFLSNTEYFKRNTYDESVKFLIKLFSRLTTSQ